MCIHLSISLFLYYRDFKVALAVYYSVKTNSVKIYIDKYPEVLPFCEITPSKSHGIHWQKISENNKIHFCDPHKNRCIKCENGHERCTLMKDMILSC